MSEQPATAVEKAKPKALTQQWKDFVTKNVPAIDSAMPRIGITAESVARTALSQMYRNTMLMQCDRLSVMRAIVEAASLGLTFALGRAYLVPFNNKVKGVDGKPDTWRLEAQLIPGYQGLVDLVRRSTGVRSVLAGAVYEGDEFRYSAGLVEDEFYHRSIVEPQDARLTHTYCIIRFLDGGYQWIVLTKKQIDAVRERSKSKDRGPWVTDYSAMAIKTAVKRCTKLCPASIELVRALELDTRAEMGEAQELAVDIDLGEGTPAEGEEQEEAPLSATEKVKKKLKGAQQPTSNETEKQADPRSPAELERRFAALGKTVGEADILVSQATSGKVQRLSLIEAAVAENVDFAAQMDAFLSLKEGGGGE